MSKALKEIAISLSKKQQEDVEWLTEEAPILGMVPFEPASHGLWNVYEEVTEISGPTKVQANAPLPEVDTSSDLKRVDLNFYGGDREVGEDTARQLGGPSAYFAKGDEHIMSKFGMDAEQQILYSNLRAYSVDNQSILYDGGGTTANKQHSILAVRFVPSMCMGLYNEKGVANGAILDWEWYNNGALYKNSKGQPVFGGRYKANFGYQIASPQVVGTMVNVNIGESFSTDAKVKDFGRRIDDMLVDIRANESRTYLFMHPRVRNAIGREFKDNKVQMKPADKNYSTEVLSWEGTRMITSHNFLDGTEAVVAGGQ